MDEWTDGHMDYRTCDQLRTMHVSLLLDISSNGSGTVGLIIWFEHELENVFLVL